MGPIPAPAPARRYAIWTIGCQMNEADSRRLAERLDAAGWRPTSHEDEAELVILNTCVVRQPAEDKVYGRLNQLRRRKQRQPELMLALMGCLVGVHPAADLARRFPFVDVFLSPSDPEPLLDLLGAPPAAEPESAVVFHGGVRANVPVVLGCSHACTYCVIPYRRGPEHSRPPEDVLREARALVAAGARELTLLGQIVDRYGMDLPGRRPDLADLLRQVAEIPGLYRLRFLTSHPGYFSDRLLDALATVPKICPVVELPVQAGNDEVLARMRRGYRTAEYEALAAKLRAARADLALHTDVIVGFPGETRDQFLDTLALIRRLRPDKVHLAKYSPRPQTYAARRLADDVPPEEKEWRRLTLDAAQVEIQTEKNAARVGADVEALVDGRDAKHGRWRGRTERDTLVFFDGPENPDLVGARRQVRVRSASPFALVGEPISASSP